MAHIVGALTTSHVPMIGQALHAKRQREVPFSAFFDSFAAVHRWVEQVQPDAAILFYNDHGLNFFLDNMPTIAIGAAAQYSNADEGWGPPKPLSFKGDQRLSWHIIKSLIADEFDVATCQEMVLDHAGGTALELLWQDTAAPIVTVPVVINAVQPPLPTPRRCYRLGQAIGRAIGSYDEDLKVLVIGSGGLSHQLGQLGSINEEYDQRCMDRMINDPEALASLTNDEIIEHAGNQGLEILTWIATRGACSGPLELVTSKYHSPISHTGGAMMLFDSRCGLGG